MAFNTIVTRRLILRSPRIDDLADFLAYRNHPENLRFQPVEPMTEANAAAFLEGQATIDTSAGQCWMMCAVERRTGGRMVGEVGVFLSPPIQRTGNIGWAIHPDYQRQGFASEAARALLDHLFAARNLHRVTATGDPRNVASTRVMERLGMRREGSMLKSLWTKGAWQDESLYAILNEEWQSRLVKSSGDHFD